MKIPFPVKNCAILALVSLISSCDDSPKIVTFRSSSEIKMNREISALVAKLDQEDGGSAFVELHRKGAAGFSAIADAMVQGKIGIEKYTDWSYDLQTRWDDGLTVHNDFENYLFSRAQKDELFAKKLAENFFSKFPREMVESLRGDSRPGAQRVAHHLVGP